MFVTAGPVPVPARLVRVFKPLLGPVAILLPWLLLGSAPVPEANGPVPERKTEPVPPGADPVPERIVDPPLEATEPVPERTTEPVPRGIEPLPELVAEPVPGRMAEPVPLTIERIPVPIELDPGWITEPVPETFGAVPRRDAELEAALVPMTEAELVGTLSVPIIAELFVELRLAAVPMIVLLLESTLLEAVEAIPELGPMIEPVPGAPLGAVPVAEIEPVPVAVTEFDVELPGIIKNAVS